MELVEVHCALDVWVDRSGGERGGDDGLLVVEVLPSEDEEEDEEGEEGADDELEVVVPDVVDVGSYPLLELLALLLLFGVEVLEHVLVGEGAVELDRSVHCAADYHHAHSHAR